MYGQPTFNLTPDIIGSVAHIKYRLFKKKNAKRKDFSFVEIKLQTEAEVS